TDDPAVEALRNRQVKNYFATTMMSLGMPMMVMGDEMRRSQQGNNNAYGQDNEISWLDWTLLGKHADVHRFVRLLNGRRRQRSAEPERKHLRLERILRRANSSWHGVTL